MTLIDFLSFIGVPSILCALWGFIYKILIKKINLNNSETNAIKLGIQALLRNNLYSMYNKYIDLGYAPLYAKENFENMYTQYHSLGSNGVMDEIRDKFRNLPTEKPKED